MSAATAQRCRAATTGRRISADATVIVSENINHLSRRSIMYAPTSPYRDELMTMTSDVRLARKYGPMTVKTLATNMVREARHRTRPRPVPPNIEVTDFDPFDPVTAADPYPRYRELLAGGPVHYNPRRGIFILSRYADVRAARAPPGCPAPTESPTVACGCRCC